MEAVINIHIDLQSPQQAHAQEYGECTDQARLTTRQQHQHTKQRALHQLEALHKHACRVAVLPVLFCGCVMPWHSQLVECLLLPPLLLLLLLLQKVA
jgi:hypothetical protein